MRSFYELFDLDLLAQRAVAAGFSKKLARLSIAGYRAPRWISSAGRVAPPVSASRGVIAGCSLATTWVKVYCLQPFLQFTGRHLNCKLDAYIDDLTVSLVADSAEELEEQMVNAGLDLFRMVKEELKGEIAMEKSVVIASCDKVAAAVAARLGCLGVVPAKATASLGVDLTSGRKRKVHVD